MNRDHGIELSLKSYLLGDLNPDEQEQLERRLMTDSDAYEALQLAEDELIDDYLEGSLSGPERGRFENIFLAAPERKQKLSFARSLKRYLAAHKPKKKLGTVLQNSWRDFWHPPYRPLKIAFTASLILIFSGGLLFVMQTSRLQNAHQLSKALLQKRLIEFQDKNSELIQVLQTEQDRNSQLKQQVADLQRDKKSSPSLLPNLGQTMLLIASLDPGRNRSSDGNKEINIPPGEGWIQLDLKMEPLEYPRYQATLQRVGGTIIRTQTESSIEGYFPGLVVSSELTTPGTYELSLSGITAAGDIEEIGTYYFQVNRE